MNDLIKHKLELLPNNPGCYLHKDKFGNIIYVGKAKNLKNRVRSYFRGSHDTKTELLVSEIADFEFIVTESNIEARWPCISGSDSNAWDCANATTSPKASTHTP